MIHYQLQCGKGHPFDGWFRDSAAFDQQAADHLLECPECGDPKVTRALMTPSVPRKRGRAAAPVVAEAPPPASASTEVARPEAPAASAPVAVSGDRMPDQMRAMLQRLRSEVEKRCDYVGPDFAEEARRIHRGESDRRGIYGETTPEQAEDLAEEGIDVARIPWVSRSDA